MIESVLLRGDFKKLRIIPLGESAGFKCNGVECLCPASLTLRSFVEQFVESNFRQKSTDSQISLYVDLILTMIKQKGLS